MVWENEFDSGNGFGVFGGEEVYARSIVNRAIQDWNAAIVDQNFDNDNNPATTPDFDLTIIAGNLVSLLGPDYANTRGAAGITDFTDGGAGQIGWTVDVPLAATIYLDDDAATNGWFFDNSPEDDAEFVGVANAFQASFVDASSTGQSSYNDFYRTITHEIGHALGITANPGAAIESMLTPVTNSLGAQYTLGGEEITYFESTLFNPEFGVNVFFVGGHFYEGVPGAPDPVYVDGTPTSLVGSPNELMNRGTTVPPAGADPLPTTRQFISDLTVQVLADAYGYDVTLPSTINTAHASLDPYTGTLLVQGLSGSDDIDVTLVGAGDDTIRVEVNGTTEDFVREDVRQILIAGNGGTDSIVVAPALQSIQQDVDYVVSSNEDAIETSGVGEEHEAGLEVAWGLR